MRKLVFGWLAVGWLFAHGANATTFTYVSINETLTAGTFAIGTANGGVNNNDAKTAAATAFTASVDAPSLDNDTVTGTFSLADAQAAQNTLLDSAQILSLGNTDYHVEVQAGGGARAESRSFLDVVFTIDTDAAVSVVSLVDCTGPQCSASVQLLDPLGTTLFNLSTQGGQLTATSPIQLFAGVPYHLLGEAHTLGALTGVGSEDGDSQFSVGILPAFVPEPTQNALLGVGLLASVVAWPRSRPRAIHRGPSQAASARSDSTLS